MFVDHPSHRRRAFGPLATLMGLFVIAGCEDSPIAPPIAPEAPDVLMAVLPSPASSKVIILNTPPASVMEGELVDDNNLHVFQERTNFPLPSAVTIGGTNIPAGTLVNSYLIHEDRTVGGSISGVTVAFGEEIIAFTGNLNELDVSDEVLGAAETTYPGNQFARGVEEIGNVSQVGTSSLSISTLSVNGNLLDQLRVVTVGEPVFTSGGDVLTWDVIYPASDDPNWPTTVCISNPTIDLGSAWGNNPRPAYKLGTATATFQTHSNVTSVFSAEWINNWNSHEASDDPNGKSFEDSWTRYTTTIAGNGDFVLNLVADNCSWVYVDGVLVGVQLEDVRNNPPPVFTYPVTLSGTHTLDFIVFDGGGQAGGMFLLETNTGTDFSLDTDNDGLKDHEEGLLGTDPNDDDTDGDGALDGADPEPTRTNHYSWIDWQAGADIAGGTATGLIDVNGTPVTVQLRVADPDGPAPFFSYHESGVNSGGISGGPDNWFTSHSSTYTSGFVLNAPGFLDDMIGLDGGQESGHPLSS
jgi:hypothetical protein